VAEMENALIRIGNDKLPNESELDKKVAFDLLFGGFHELVYTPDYLPLQFVNSSWMGALGHMMSDNRMGWKPPPRCFNSSYTVSSCSITQGLMKGAASVAMVQNERGRS